MAALLANPRLAATAVDPAAIAALAARLTDVAAARALPLDLAALEDTVAGWLAAALTPELTIL